MGGSRVKRGSTNQIYLSKEEGTVEIKVLGPGCAKCEQTEKNVKEAVAEKGIDARIDKVTDVMEIAKYGVFGTPAVIVDGEVKCVGKVPKTEEIASWITK
jgi:small redox-active disulfide protein 2